jgi:hypothetical protein
MLDHRLAGNGIHVVDEGEPCGVGAISYDSYEAVATLRAGHSDGGIPHDFDKRTPQSA